VYHNKYCPLAGTLSQKEEYLTMRKFAQQGGPPEECPA